MENIATPGATQQPVSTPTFLDRARAARAAYDNAVCADGVTESAWWGIASALHFAAADVAEAVGHPDYPWLTMGVVQTLADRAKDAEGRAQYAARMTRVAAMSRRQIIPVVHAIEVGGAS